MDMSSHAGAHDGHQLWYERTPFHPCKLDKLVQGVRNFGDPDIPHPLDQTCLGPIPTARQASSDPCHLSMIDMDRRPSGIAIACLPYKHEYRRSLTRLP